MFMTLLLFYLLFFIIKFEGYVILHFILFYFKSFLFDLLFLTILAIVTSVFD